MNSILQLKGQFQHQPIKINIGPRNIPKEKSVKASHLINLQQQLMEVLAYWQQDQLIGGALTSVYYWHIVAKSNRLQGLLRGTGKDPSDFVCGAKFYGDDPIQHVFTYYTPLQVIEKSITNLGHCISYVESHYNGEITYANLEAIGKNTVPFSHPVLSKSPFLSIIADAYYTQRFTIDRVTDIENVVSIVTLYKTDITTSELLMRLGIDMINAKIIDDTTVRLTPAELLQLKNKAPYLIAMKTKDLSELMLEDIVPCDANVVNIPSPKLEPTIGVIDTLFDPNVYFKDWVTSTSLLDPSIPTSPEDYIHGTEVTSLIVDGPSINPDLDDGCGRFRVKHFGVATSTRFSTYSILKAIRQIVAQHTDIKVWNLSLGSPHEVNRNFISPEAAEIDKIQSEYDVIFIIAGTNKPSSIKGKMMVGAPADSLNAIVVNAVTRPGKIATYHRVGPVLSFFHKPDLSYYGGDQGDRIRVCGPTGEGFVSGTSFAAPWIARKMAFLIHTMGFSREVAKALLIDSAAGWDRQDDVSHAMGYGIVPKRIEDILQTRDDEIRFFLTGSTEAYETYTYNIPIPVAKEKHPFYARATLCYFPHCSKNQGVDYTCTEMDIHFGRIEEKNGKSSIKSINGNKQSDEEFTLLREHNARLLYRKWDNVKLISDEIKSRPTGRKIYGKGIWGLRVECQEMTGSKHGRGMLFGVVITLKEMYGKNRIDEFMKLCMIRGWIVNRIDVQERADVFRLGEEELRLE